MQSGIDNSPILGNARQDIAIRKKAEEITATERLPKIGIQAGWSIDGPILVEVPPINRNLSYWYVGVGISYNISSLYKKNRKIAESRIATKKTIEEYEAAKENLTMAGYC